jgi:hypothetical protein
VGESDQPHDDEEVQLKSSMVQEDQMDITADKYAAPDDLVSRTRRVKSCNESDHATEDIETALAEDQSTGRAKGDGAMSTANENLSFTSSLSSKPSSDFNTQTEVDREGTASYAVWDDDHLASNELSFEANSDTFDNSEKTGDLRDLVPSGPGVRKRLLADNENAFIGLYNDIVYLLVHGNKPQDDNEPADPRGYNDLHSQQDSCGSDRSDVLDPEGDQARKEDIPAMCFLCGNVNPYRSSEENMYIKSFESNISATSIQYGPTVEARDAYIENVNSGNENSRESCPRETIDEQMIPIDFIPDEAIFDKADSEESEESCEVEINEKGTEVISISAEVATKKKVEGVGEVAISVSLHVESSEFACWHSSADHHPFDDEDRPRESLFQIASRRLEHRPIMPPHVDAFHSKKDQEHSTDVNDVLKSDDDDILQVVMSIQARVESTHSRSLAPDLARRFRPDFDEDLPTIDQDMDSIEIQWIRLQKVKDILFAESKPAISTSSVHVQPVQELGESRNMHIELPVGNIPNSVLPLEDFNWKKELDILNAIVKEDFCDKTSNSDFCLETTLSKETSIRSIMSIGELKAGYSVKTLNRAVPECESQSEVNVEAEFFQISNQDTHDDRSSLLAWLNLMQKIGCSNERTDLEFENYLNQPAKNADLDWQNIPVPEIEDQLQRLEATCVQNVKKSPNEARRKRVRNRPLLQLASTALTDKVAKAHEPSSESANSQHRVYELLAPPDGAEENDQSHLLSLPGNAIKDATSSQFSEREETVNSKSDTRIVRTAQEAATRYGDSNASLDSGMVKDDLNSLKTEDVIEATAAKSSMDLIDLNTPESSVLESQTDELCAQESCVLESQTDEEVTHEMNDCNATGIAKNKEDVDAKNSSCDDDVRNTAELSSADLVDLQTPENSAVEGVSTHETNEMVISETPETISDPTRIADNRA